VLVADGTPRLQVTVMVSSLFPCLKDTAGADPASLSPSTTLYGLVAVQDRI
jgi:hypothetical protein